LNAGDPNEVAVMWRLHPELAPKVYPYPGNANRRDNWDPHIVYYFIFTPNDGGTPILKYGISDMLKYDMDRPEAQLPGLRAMFGSSTTFFIYSHTTNRDHALFVERLLVTQHFNKWGYMPRVQKSPLPFN
jgi:hypothetical protein